MYDAGATYKNSMFTFDREMSIQVDIEYSNGLTDTFTDSDIVENSFSVDLCCVNNNAFCFGASIMNECNISLINKKSVVAQFEGAIIEPKLIVQESANSTSTVTIPVGKFDVITTEIVDTDDNVRLKCYDFMNRLNVKNAESVSGKLYKILSRVCYMTGITFGMTKEEVETFPGATVTYVLGAAAFESYRDIIEYCAEIMCGFATFDRNGRLVIRKFGNSTGVSIPQSFISAVKYDHTTFKISELQFNAGENSISRSTGVEDGYIVNYCTDNKMFTSLWIDYKQERETVIGEAAEFVADIAFKGAELTVWGDVALDLGDTVTVTGYGNIVLMHVTYNMHGLQTLGCFGVAKDSFSGTTKAGRSIINLANSQNDIKIDIKKFGSRHNEVPKNIGTLAFDLVLECSDYKIIMDGAASEASIVNNYAVVADDAINLVINPRNGTGEYFYSLFRNVDGAGWVTVGENQSINIFLEQITSTLNISTLYKVICRDSLNNEVTSYYNIQTVSTISNIPAGAVGPNEVLEFTQINTSVPSTYLNVMRETVSITGEQIQVNNTLTIYAEQDGILTFFNTISTDGTLQNTPLICKQHIHQGYNTLTWVDCILLTRLPDNLLITVGIGVASTVCVHLVTNGSHMMLMSLTNKKLVPQPPEPEEHQYVFKNISINVEI